MKSYEIQRELHFAVGDSFTKYRIRGRVESASEAGNDGLRWVGVRCTWKGCFRFYKPVANLCKRSRGAALVV